MTHQQHCKYIAAISKQLFLYGWTFMAALCKFATAPAQALVKAGRCFSSEKNYGLPTKEDLFYFI